eukprot:4034786-Pyramimonas_sp.AAC.1
MTHAIVNDVFLAILRSGCSAQLARCERMQLFGHVAQIVGAMKVTVQSEGGEPNLTTYLPPPLL